MGSTLRIELTKKFSKDFKKISKQGKDIRILEKTLDLLAHTKSLPLNYRDHELIGEYKDCRECHLKPDWFLVYKKAPNSIILIRTGSHSELFN